nr:TRAP transporter small permease subunit [Amylibacter sp.]
MRRFLTGVIWLCAAPGRFVGWLVLAIILMVCLAVAAAQLGINNYGKWDANLFLLGRGISVNTLLDLQWWCFALVVLFGGAVAFREDKHVSVDFLSSNFSPRVQLILQTIGDLVLLVPFCAIIIWYGSKFALTAWTSGEGSSYGGLSNIWVIKTFVPIGFALLGLAGLARAGQSIHTLIFGAQTKDTPHE